MLSDALHSLVELASDRARIEVLVGLDLDDNSGSMSAVMYAPCRVIEYFSERHGYRELHRYYNRLAERARGDWLMIWNDDALMRTVGWDEAIGSHDPSSPVALNLTSESPGGMNLFPCVSRRWYELVGHLSLQAHTDTWIQDVSRAVGCEVAEPRIRIEHLREGDGEPEVYAVTSPEFYSPEFETLRAADVALLRGFQVVS